MLLALRYAPTGEAAAAGVIATGASETLAVHNRVAINSMKEARLRPFHMSLGISDHGRNLTH